MELTSEDIFSKEQEQRDFELNLSNLSKIAQDYSVLRRKCSDPNAVLLLDDVVFQIEDMEDRLKQITLYMRDR